MEKITEMCNRCAADFRSKGLFRKGKLIISKDKNGDHA